MRSRTVKVYIRIGFILKWRRREDTGIGGATYLLVSVPIEYTAGASSVLLVSWWPNRRATGLTIRELDRRIVGVDAGKDAAVADVRM